MHKTMPKPPSTHENRQWGRTYMNTKSLASTRHCLWMQRISCLVRCCYRGVFCRQFCLFAHINEGSGGELTWNWRLASRLRNLGNCNPESRPISSKWTWVSCSRRKGGGNDWLPLKRLYSDSLEAVSTSTLALMSRRCTHSNDNTKHPVRNHYWSHHCSQEHKPDHHDSSHRSSIPRPRPARHYPYPDTDLRRPAIYQHSGEFRWHYLGIHIFPSMRWKIVWRRPRPTSRSHAHQTC